MAARIIASVLALFEIMGQPLAALAGDYDGKWTVKVTSEEGDCGRPANYEVNVSNGRIAYFSYTSISLYGTVSPQGDVVVSMRHFSDTAQGNGHLDANSGGGLWRGVGKYSGCAGRWLASRP
jgi:hypothetical protein